MEQPALCNILKEEAGDKQLYNNYISMSCDNNESTGFNKKLWGSYLVNKDTDYIMQMHRGIFSLRSSESFF